MSVGQKLKPCHFGKKLSIYNTDDMTFVNFINSKQVVFSSGKITILLASLALPYFAIKISHINVKCH